MTDIATVDGDKPLQLHTSVPIVMGFGGGKGGGGGRVARESPDSLHSTQYARILDAINIGPTESMGDSPDEILTRIFLNGTPIVSPDGTENFPGIEVHVRYGTQDQDPIPGFPGAESTTAIGAQVKVGQPWAQFISNAAADAVRITLATDRLTEQNTKNGDLTGYFIDYEIDLMDRGAVWTNVLKASMRGKTTQRYTRTHRIDLAPDSGPWQVRVRRTSADSDSSAINSNLFVESVTEVVDQKLRYPMLALVSYLIPATLFSSIPTRAVKAPGRLIRVPSNYDALTRTYSGIWDGTFKLSASANPAWVLMDLILSDIFGLGDRIDLGMLDRWALYRIAQYCDELVPDGQGGMEPRFRAVGQIAQKEDAYKLLQDIASIFHGITYTANGTVVTSADMPDEPVYTFSQANIVGRFEYGAPKLDDIHNAVQVSYSNPEDFGRQKVEPVEDTESIRRFGIRPLSIASFLNVSRGQAQRLGRWRIKTANLQDRLVKFKVGLDFAIVRPGMVIKIADNVLAGAVISGRVAAVESRSSITLDRRARVRPGDILSVNMPSGVLESQRVETVLEMPDAIQVGTTEFSELPQADSGWCVDAEDLKPFWFRVTGVARTGTMEAEITAVIEIPGKHQAIDYETKLGDLDNSIIPSLLMNAPSNVQVEAFTAIDQNAASNTLRITWTGSKDARNYSVQWRRDDSNWIALPDTTLEQAEVENIRAGRYQARVQAVSALDVRSQWVLSDLRALNGDLDPPPAPAFLTTESQLYGITVRWGVPAGSVSPIRRTELWFAPSNNFAAATLLTEASYPADTFTLSGLPAGTEYWFWVRFVDSLGESGAFFPPLSDGGVHGSTELDAGKYLEAIKELVMSSDDGKYLTEQVVQITENLDDLLTKVNGQGDTLDDYGQQLIQIGQDLLTEAQARAAGDLESANSLAAETQARINQISVVEGMLGARIDTLSAQVADIAGTEPWNSTRQYEVDDLAQGNGGLYRAIQASQNKPLNDTAYWTRIGDYNSISEAVGDLSSKMVSVQAVQAQQATKVTQLETGQGEQGSRIQTLESTSTTQGQRLLTLETTSGEQGSSISALQETTAGQATQLSGLQTTQGEQATKIQGLESTTAGQGTRLSSVETTQGEQGTKLTNLEQTSASQGTRVGNLETSVAGQGSRIQTVEQTQATQSQRMTTIESTQSDQSSKIIVLETSASNLAQRTSALETSSGNTSAAVTDLQSATSELAIRLAEVRATSSEGESSISRLDRVTSDLARSTVRVSARLGQAEASVISEREARVSADAALGARVDQTNATVAQNAASITANELASVGRDNALAARLTIVEANAGKTLETFKSWGFDAGMEGWEPYNTSNGGLTWSGAAFPQHIQARNVSGNTGVFRAMVKLTADAYDPRIYPILRFKVRWPNKPASGTHTVYFLTNVNPSPGSQLMQITPNPDSADWQTFDVDLSTGPAWMAGVTQIVGILMTSTNQSNGGGYDLDQVSVGRYGEPLGRAVVLDEQAARAGADAILASRIGIVEAKSSESFDTYRIWNFDSDLEGFTTASSAATTLTWVNAQPYYGRAAPVASSPSGSFFSPLLGVPNLDGRIEFKRYPILRARVRFPGGLVRSDFYFAAYVDGTTAQGTNLGGRWLAHNLDLTSSDWQYLELDLNSYFTAAELEQYTYLSRFILGSTGQGAQLTFEVDYIAFGRVSQPLARGVILDERRAWTAADSANASATQQVQTNLNGTNATVQAISQSVQTLDGKVSSNWNVKVQQNTAGKYYLAGITVGLEQAGGGTTADSYITMLADRFTLLSSVNGAYEAPFAVVNGQTFIKTAFFQDASIEDAKIKSLNATKITAGTMSADRIDANSFAAKVANMDTAYVKTANIGVAQVDTLRLANGSVVAGSGTSFSAAFGASGNIEVGIATQTINLPYGGTVLCFVSGSWSGGSWAGRVPTMILYLNSSPFASATGNPDASGAIFSGYTFITASLPAGTYTLAVQGYRPTGGTVTYTGSFAILGFQR